MTPNSGLETQEKLSAKQRLSRRRRGPHDIVLKILKICENGSRKTHVLEKARLSHSQLKRYLTALEKAGFVAESSNIWRTTEKGLHVIEACEICQRLVKKGI